MNSNILRDIFTIRKFATDLQACDEVLVLGYVEEESKIRVGLEFVFDVGKT